MAERAEVHGRGVGFGETVGAVHGAAVKDAVRDAEHVAGFVIEHLAGAAQANNLVFGLRFAAPEFGIVAAQAVNADALFKGRDAEDKIEERVVRFRTVGDATCTAAVESAATTLDDIIREIEETNISERGATRLDDQTSDAAMEDRKKGGYF